MLFLLIPIVFIAVWIVVGIGESDGTYGFLSGLLSSIGVGLLCMILSVSIECNANVDYKMAESCEISALVDNARYSHTVSGSVFLIQARTDEDLKYSYMYYEEGRGYAFGEVDAEDSYINYTDEQPRLERYEPYFTNEFVHWLLGYPVSSNYYVFYLPHDAEIIDSYVIDFE